MSVTFIFPTWYFRYSIMLNCWQFNPRNRPYFPQLVQRLDQVLSMSCDQVRPFSMHVMFMLWLLYYSYLNYWWLCNCEETHFCWWPYLSWLSQMASSDGVMEFLVVSVLVTRVGFMQHLFCNILFVQIGSFVIINWDRLGHTIAHNWS